MDTSSLKLKFAEEWLRHPNDPFRAAIIAAGQDTVLACRISAEWQNDPEVLQYKEDLLEERGEEAFLPTACQLVHDILDRSRTSTNDDYVKLLRLAAEIRGLIQKPGVTINNTVVTNKVMTIPIRGDSIDWEQGLIAQQKGLLTHA